jgi:hypothetical protein
LSVLATCSCSDAITPLLHLQHFLSIIPPPPPTTIPTALPRNNMVSDNAVAPSHRIVMTMKDIHTISLFQSVDQLKLFSCGIAATKVFESVAVSAAIFLEKFHVYIITNPNIHFCKN